MPPELIERAMTLVWGRSAPDAGPLLFRQGLVFSVGLTLLPTILAVGSWCVRVAIWLTR